MNAFERWFLRIADSDYNWIGLNWLRPAKTRRISAGWILLSSVLLGLPGILLGLGILFHFFGRVPPGIGTVIVGLSLGVELLLHLLFAIIWNKRALNLAVNEEAQVD